MKMKIGYRAFGLMLTLAVAWMLSMGNASAAEQATPKGDVGYEAGFYYTVKKGDTLWDLSQRFSDTPWQWPDLWHENQQLPNPHWIYPGERIRLYRKTGEYQVPAPPQQEVPQIEPQVEATAPVEPPKPQVDYVYANLDRVGFIRNPAVKPTGEIFKCLDNKTLISEDDQIYIRYPLSGKNGDFAPGMRLMAYRALHPSGAGGYGTQHYIVGIVEVMTVNGDYAIAKVAKSFRTIKIGDLLMPYTPSPSSIPVVKSTPGINGRLLIGEEHSKILGDLFTAFIDKGSDNQIEPGQMYDLYYQEYGPGGPGGKTIALAPVTIGSLLVLRTEKQTSTVLITSSNRSIEPGQPFQTP